MTNPQRKSVPTALLLCLVNWLIPGLGFIAAKDYKRGLLLFLLINITFAVGFAFSGFVLVPTVNFSNALDNVVAVLTFIVQICHGGGCGLILFSQKIGGPLAEIFVKNPGNAYSDIGSFHFLVAGGLNYFATVRLYDLLAGEIPITPAATEAKSSASTNAPSEKEEIS